MSASKLIKNAWVVTNDTTLGEIQGGSLLIEGTMIKAVGKVVESPVSCEVIDGTGMIVIPGLVDSHKHLWQTALRGICGDLTLSAYLHLIRQKFIAAYQPEDARVGSYASALEMINGGTTAVLDHAHCIVSPEHADAAIEGTMASGIRGVWAYGYCPVSESATFAAHGDRIRDAYRVRNQHFGSNDGLLRMGIAITEQNLLPFELTELELRSALDMGVQWTGHTHCGTGPAPFTRGIHKLYAKNLLNSQAILSHCNEFSYNDFMMMKEVGAHFASSPDTELYMGLSKPPNFTDALSAGIDIALGTDTVSCMSADLFTTMRVAMIFARHQLNEPAAAGYRAVTRQRVSVRDIFRWATLNGARAMGIDHLVGSLSPGKRADVVMIDTRQLNLAPVTDPVASLVLAGQMANVDTVLIDGRIRKRGGVLIGVDMPRLLRELESSRQRLFQTTNPDAAEQASLSDDVQRWTERLSQGAVQG